MSKAQRLFDLVTILKGRRTAITARDLAARLEVSERTIYRDMDALVVSGVAVEGEAGVGYRLRPGSHLPPLMFDTNEALALVLGLRMVKAQTDPELAAAAERAEERMRAVMTDDLKRGLDQLPYRLPRLSRSPVQGEIHARLRHGIIDKTKLDLDYADVQGLVTRRRIRPLGIVGWGDRWTVLAWCELRNAYRNFRLDRVQGAVLTDQSFETGPTLSVEHYFKTEWENAVANQRHEHRHVGGAA